ncbi:hypothetical protein ACR9E3_22760 [Actinomycetospora sp. C-140]
MIGWLAAGALLHLEGKAQQKRKEARRAERARRRRESPMPNAVWVIYGILLVSAIASPPAVPGMLIIGVCIGIYAQKRRKEHEAWKAYEAWKAQQPPTLVRRATELSQQCAAQWQQWIAPWQQSSAPFQHPTQPQPPTLRQRADSYERLGMPISAQVMRDLHELGREQESEARCASPGGGWWSLVVDAGAQLSKLTDTAWRELQPGRSERQAAEDLHNIS